MNSFNNGIVLKLFMLGSYQNQD